MKLYASVLVVVALASIMTLRAADADVSDALVGALTTLQGLNQSSFSSVTGWARNGAPQVAVPIRDYELAEAQILNLSSDDRQAVLWWLQGNGRSSLYARGATDAQIGPLRSGADPGTAPPSPAPDSWRDLRLASATLGDAAVPSGIVILGGFAAARRDGTSAMACVSFKNIAPVAADEVRIDFPLLDGAGNTVGKLTLDRRGTFSQGIGIMTYGSLQDFVQSGGIGNRGFGDNCATVKNGIAAVPILTARYATYRITKVTRGGGSTWP
ncbi:MAG: hypothetical protein M3R44_07220 [Candidatus Eremiobacteraeota bacterium]|nr:hypothetical protein [Candidatus Eremiobacteraeota bacterium]